MFDLWLCILPLFIISFYQIDFKPIYHVIFQSVFVIRKTLFIFVICLIQKNYRLVKKKLYFLQFVFFFFFSVIFYVLYIFFFFLKGTPDFDLHIRKQKNFQQISTYRLFIFFALPILTLTTPLF